MEKETLREPVVCVLGHVDHGKTTFLDAVRGTSIAKSEKGGITQRIGATEISRGIIEKYSREILGNTKIRIPGLLFIDTPGHVAFANMRARGGALADIAILVVDINEGLKPQTIESLNILKKFKTPFIVVANKIDMITMFRQSNGSTFKECLAKQRPEWVTEFEKKFYELVGRFYDHGFSAERYDKITDFKKTLMIVPVSARSSVGIQDVIVMLSGLAQRFLESEISLGDSAQAAGTVIEVQREESLGLTLDTVLYQGSFRRGQTVALNTKQGIDVTKIKALLINSGNRGKTLEEREYVSAASAVRILIADRLEVVPGTPVYSVESEEEREKAFEEITKQTQPNIEISPTGIHVKADALGSLEAISYELMQRSISIRYAGIGDISRRDIVSTETVSEPLDRLIIGFNVSLLPDAQAALGTSEANVLTGNVIYSIVEETENWIKQKKEELIEEKKHEMPIPSKISIMPEYIFRSTKPVIVGIKVHAGRVKVGDRLIKADGRYGGTVRSLRDGEISKKFCDAPGEIAAAIEGVTLNRQIIPGETLYVDIPEGTVRNIRDSDLDDSILSVLDEIIRIKRKEDMFWGTRA